MFVASYFLKSVTPHILGIINIICVMYATDYKWCLLFNELIYVTKICLHHHTWVCVYLLYESRYEVYQNVTVFMILIFCMSCPWCVIFNIHNMHFFFFFFFFLTQIAHKKCDISNSRLLIVTPLRWITTIFSFFLLFFSV